MTDEATILEAATPPPVDDTPSMRGLVFCKDPTEAFELDILNLEGVIIGMRVDGSSILYIPWSRVKHVEVPKSQPSTTDDEH